MAELHVPVVLPIDECHPVDWNPNQEDVQTFNNLVEQIEEDGFIEPITVVKDADGYAIIAGEHRWKAAKLSGMSEITAVVKKWDSDEQKIKSIRMNTTRGKFDPEKFSSAWEELVGKYGREQLMRKMGMAHKESQVQRLIGDMKKSMPKELADELDRRADKIRSIDDLAVVIQSLYARFGSTVDKSYMFVTFGGQVHLVVSMDEKTKKKVTKRIDQIVSDGGNANRLVEDILEKL